MIKRSSAELRWLRIQSVNRELALTLTVGSLVYVTLSSEHALAVKKPRQSRRGSTQTISDIFQGYALDESWLFEDHH